MPKHESGAALLADKTRLERKMTDEKEDQEGDEESSGDLSRRGFLTLSLAVGLPAAIRSVSGRERALAETNVEAKTPDGTCDAVFIHPTDCGGKSEAMIWKPRAFATRRWRWKSWNFRSGREEADRSRGRRPAAVA